MSEGNPNNIYNLPEDQIKMPENNFLGVEKSRAKFSIVPILIVIILLLMVALGGLLYWGWDILFPEANLEPEVAQTSETPIANEPIQTETRATNSTDAVSTLGTSDEIDVIANDLIETDTRGLDREMSELEAIFSN